jgi:FKBP-type peptidyl-prolyl cis-trans isomerase FkpA
MQAATAHFTRNRTLTLAAACLLFSCSHAFAADLTPQTEEQKTLYAIGVSVARSLNVFNLTPAEFAMVQKGLSDAQAGTKNDFDLGPYNSKIQELARQRRQLTGMKQVAAGKDFLAQAAKEPGAVKTESGMVYRSLVEGKGSEPKPSDSVKVNYRGTLPDGWEFDSSYRRNRPLEFRLDGVIKCWVEGLSLIHISEPTRPY